MQLILLQSHRQQYCESLKAKGGNFEELNVDFPTIQFITVSLVPPQPSLYHFDDWNF